MKTRYKLLIAGSLAALIAAPAMADLTYTQGAGTTIFDFVCFTTKHCSAHVPVNSAGTEIFTSAAPAQVSLANTGANAIAVKVDNSAVTQPISAVSLPTHGVTAASGAIASGAIASGAMVDLGAQADAAAAADNSTASLIALLKRTNQNVTTLNTTAGSATPAGTNTIGNVNGAPNVTPTDCSGTITTGGTAQSAIAAQTTLHGFTIANIDTSAGSGEPIWISFTTTAAASTAASYPLAAPTATTFAGLASFTTPPGFGTNHAVSIVGATTGHKFSCTWW